MDTKICSKCNVEKPLDSFHNSKKHKNGKYPSCRECKSKDDKAYRESHKEEKAKKDHAYYEKNAEKIKEYSKKWYSEQDIERMRNLKVDYNQRNKEHLTMKKKEYIQNHLEAHRAYMNEYQKARYRNNLDYRIKSITNSRIRSCIRRKKDSTMTYLGCSIEFLRDWFESQFDENMSWDNMGTYWHIDHVNPCDSYELTNEDELMECFNWKNLQPLSAEDNLRKHNFVDEALIEEHALKAQMFEELYHDVPRVK